MARNRASFSRMEGSTQADWDLIGPVVRRSAQALPDRILAHLQLLGDETDGFPVSRLAHSLQCATLAREDGRDEEYVVCALLHDIGDTLGSFNHAEVAASILEPFVSERNYWMVQKHAIFQGHYFFQYIGLDPNLQDTLKSHPYYDYGREFVERFDNPAFDAHAKTLPLATFVPLVRQVLAKPKKSLYLRSTCVAEAADKDRPMAA